MSSKQARPVYYSEGGCSPPWHPVELFNSATDEELRDCFNYAEAMESGAYAGVSIAAREFMETAASYKGRERRRLMLAAYDRYVEAEEAASHRQATRELYQAELTRRITEAIGRRVIR